MSNYITEQGLGTPVTPATAPLESKDGQWQILDGDTVRDTQTGEVFRLGGIDTAETGKKRGEYSRLGQVGSYRAQRALKEILDGGNFQPQRRGEGHYGRTIADMRDDTGRDAATELVEQGDARLSYTDDPELRAAQVRSDMNFVPDEAYRQAVVRAGEEYGVGGRPTYDPRNAFQKATDRGTNTMQASLYGFTKAFGDWAEFDALSDWGEEGMLRNLHEAAASPADVQSWDDVDTLDEFGTFVAEALGEQLPQLLGDATAAVFGGGLGGIAARRGATKALLRKLGPERADKLMDNVRGRKTIERVARAKAMATGAKSAALGSIYAQSSGETALELHGAGDGDTSEALLYGIPKSAAEYLPLARGVNLLRQSTRISSNELGKFAGNLLIQMGVEGSTEGLQTVLDFIAVKSHKGEDIFDLTDEDWKELRTAVAKGAVVGGGITLPSGVFPAYRAARAKYLAGRNDQATPTAASPDEEAAVNDFHAGVQEASQPQPRETSQQEVAPEQAVAPEQDAEVVTTQESDKALAEQTKRVQEGVESSVFASAENAEVHQDIQESLPDAHHIQTDQGQFSTTDEALAEQYGQATPQEQDNLRAQALGYTQTKEEVLAEAAQGAEPVVVRTVQPDGTVVKDEATTRPEEAVANQETKAASDERVEVVDAAKNLADREEAVRAPKRYASQREAFLAGNKEYGAGGFEVIGSDAEGYAPRLINELTSDGVLTAPNGDRYEHTYYSQWQEKLAKGKQLLNVLKCLRG